MADDVVRYRSAEEDSERWREFPFRPGDIVISTRSKSGTTWMQMICALLVFQTAKLPEPLAVLSPWLDWLVVPREEMYARLAAQRHRRFIKTHTPLDGVPIKPEVTYLVVARHPLDMAVSLYHQGDNLDRERIRQLTGAPEPDRPMATRPPLREWLVSWVERVADPRAELDSLPGVLRHLSDAWRRRQEPNVVLVHYDDLSADLAGQMRRLAGLLGITVPEQVWPELVEAATFRRMRERADQLTPDPVGVMKDRARFFRQGRSGAGRELLNDQELARYHARTAELAPPDLLGWLHRDPRTTHARWVIEQRPWDDPAGAALRAAQRDELDARYGRTDHEPGPLPSGEDTPVFLVAVDRSDGRAVACGGLRPLDETSAEIKRMYVVPSARGTGVAAELLRALEAAALDRHWTVLRLETGIAQPDALRFYEREGYHRIPAFGSYIGSDISVCYQRRLQ